MTTTTAIIRTFGLSLLFAFAATAHASSEGSDIEFGGHGAEPGKFADLRDITFDAKGNVYVLEGLWVNDKGQMGGNGRIQVLDQTGKSLRVIPVRDDTLGDQQDPQRIAVAKDGTMYVTQPKIGIVQRFGADGKALKPVPVPFAMGIVALDDGRVAVLPNLNSIVAGAWKWQGGERIEIIDQKGALAAPITLEKPLIGVADIAVNKAGEFFVVAATNQIYRFDKTGKLLTVLGAGAQTRNDDGSELLHSVAIDSTGALYSMTFGNPGLVLRFSPDLKTVVSHPGQFAWADSWSVHSEYTPLAVDPTDRLWLGTTHMASEGKRPSPGVLRVHSEFFKAGGNGVIEKSALSLALTTTIDSHLPHGVAYDLKPIPIDFIVAAANRRVKAVTVDWTIVDQERVELAKGSFDMPLVDGVEARHAFEYAPKAYGWCMVMADIKAEGAVIKRASHFFGVTKRYPGMIALDDKSPMFAPQNPFRTAFAGTMNVRLHAVPDAGRLAELESQIDIAKQAGVTWFVQITDRNQGTPESVRMIVDRLKGKVPVWEFMNEPNFSFSPTDYVENLKQAAAIIRELDPKAKIMGPDVCGMDLGWYEAFYAAGGGKYVDILSLHDYEGHSTADPVHWRWKFKMLREMMARYGDAGKEIWQTEHGFDAIRGENFMPGAQAVRLTLHRDLMASLGVPSEHNNHFYCDDHGFGDVPTWLWSANGPHAAVFAARVRQALVQGKACTPLDFGKHGNDLFLGLRYDGSDKSEGSIIVLRNLGMKPTPLSFAMSGTSVTLIDAFGNERTEKITDGSLKLALLQMPIYLRLAKDQAFACPSLDYGRDQAERATIVFSGPRESDPALLTDGILQTYFHGDPNGTTEGNSIWRGDLAIRPQTLDLVFDTPRAISRVVLHGVHADNQFCALLDYDLQYRDPKGAWKTIEECRNPMPPCEPLPSPGCKYATWLQDDNQYMNEFAPVTTDALRIVARRASQGLVPDDKARAWGSIIPMKLMFRELDVYGPSSPVTVSAVPGSTSHPAAFADETLTVTVANAGSAAAKASVRVLAPKGWTITPSEAPVTVDAGGKATAAMKIKAPAEMPAGRTSFDVTVVDAAGKQLDVGWASIDVAAPVELAPQSPRGLDAKAQPLAIAVTGRAEKAVSGTIRVEFVGPSAIPPVEKPFGPLASGQAATIELLVPKLDLGRGHWRARYTARVDGLVTTAEQDLAVRFWNAIGPFPNDIDKDFGPEKGVDLAKKSVDQLGNDRNWQLLVTNAAGLIDLTVFNPHENVCAYAVAYVKAPKAAKATLSLGTDDGGKVWFNRVAIHKDTGAHGAIPGETKIPVDLKAGWNEILFKVTQGNGGWGFFCELIDATGKPLTDVTWSPKPDF